MKARPKLQREQEQTEDREKQQAAMNESRLTYNREAKRRLLKKLNIGRKNKLTKDDIERMIFMERLKAGKVTDDEIATMVGKSVTHYDNAEQFPDGTPVKLNCDEILGRQPQGLSQEYVKFLEDNRDKVLHLVREDSLSGCVSVEEDVRYDQETGERVPRWLFDLSADLLVEDSDGNWVSPSTVDSNLSEYTELKSED